MSSPFIVLIGAEQFQEAGWLAIGKYDFDTYDGLYRSIYFFIITAPVIIALYLGRPKVKTNSNSIIAMGTPIKKRHLLLMIFFCITAFYFNLGITGVETDTGGFRLSGIAYYIRTYLFFLLIASYILGSKNASLSLIILYSLIAGITGGSRLVAVSPLVLLLIKHLYDKNGKFLDFRGGIILIFIYLSFSSVTFLREIIFVEDYSFDNLWVLINQYDLSESQFIFQGFSQLFLRVGIGRDVLLSYEIGGLEVCTNLVGLFLQNGSCLNPPMDFYGLLLDTDKFYLAPPMLSSLFVISNNFFLKLIVALVYAVLAYFLCTVAKLIKEVPLGNLLVQPTFFLIVIFVTIGPIYYAWILVGIITILRLLYIIIKKSAMKLTSPNNKIQ